MFKKVLSFFNLILSKIRNFLIMVFKHIGKFFANFFKYAKKHKKLSIITLIFILLITLIVAFFIIRLNNNEDENETTAIPVNGINIIYDGTLIYLDEIGEEYKINYEVLPSNAYNKKVKWTSSDSSVVSVSNDGVIKLLRYKTENELDPLITVETIDNGYKDSIYVIVPVDMDYTSKINSALNEINVNVGEKEYQLVKGFKMVLSDKIEIESIADIVNITEENIQYIWTSKNKDIINIDGNIATGSASITANTTGEAIINLVCLNGKGEILLEQDIEIEVVLDEIISISYSGLKDTYYQGEIINNDNVMLDIKYRNSKGEILQKSVSYSKLFSEELNTYTDGEINKSVNLQGYELNITYNVLQAELTNFELKGLLENYTVHSNINSTVEITLDDEIKFVYSLYELNSNINELDLKTEGIKTLQINYFNNVYEYEFNIIKKEVVNKEITGINIKYPLNSKLIYENILVNVDYSDLYNTVDASYQDLVGSLVDYYEESELNRLFDNSTIGKKVVTLYIGPYKEEFIIEYNVVDAIVDVEAIDFIIPIKDSYKLNEEVVLNIEAKYDGYTLDINATDYLLIYLNGIKVNASDITKESGDHKLEIYFGDLEKNEYQIKVLNSYIINYYDEENILISSENGLMEPLVSKTIELRTYNGYEIDTYQTNNNGLFAVIDDKFEMKLFDTDQDLIINIYYKKSTYKITYNIIGEPLVTHYYKYQEEITEYVPAEKEGYLFSGWNKSIPSVMPDSDITVKGYYVDENSANYIVKFYVEGLDGYYTLDDFENVIIISGEIASFIVDVEDKVSIKVVDNENYEYLNVEKEYVGFTYNEYEIIDNTCNVYFSRNSYSITYNYESYQHVESYLYLEDVVEFIPIKYGYTFSGWSELIPSKMPDKDIVVEGEFTPNTYKLTLYYDNYVRYYLFDCDEKFTGLPVLTDKVNEFLGWQDSEGTIHTKMPSYDLTLYPAWKEYIEISSYLIEGLESNYLLNEEIDYDNIYIIFKLKDNSEHRVKLTDILVSGNFDTSSIGIKELVAKYENQNVTLYYEVSETKKEIVKVEITDFPEYFYYLDNVDLSKYYLKIYYKDSYVELPLTSSKLSVIGLDLESVGTKSLIITYLSEVIAIPYEVVNPISISTSEVLIIDKTYSFYINIDENYLNNGYLLNIANSSDYSYSYNNEGNGKYYVTITLKNVSEANVIIGIHNLPCYESLHIVKINLEDLDLIIEGKDYGNINKALPLTLSIYYNDSKYNMSGINYDWRISGDASINSNGNYCSIISSSRGKFTVTVTVSINGEVKTISKDIEIIDPYEGIRFTDNKVYGIGEVLTLGGFRYNTNHNLVSKTYTFDIVGKTNVNRDNLIWYTSNDEIATFGSNGELNIHGDGYVTLYVTSIDAFNYGLTSSTYVGSFTVRCVYDAVYVTTYEDIVRAFENNKQVVLGNSIDIGYQVMTLKKDSNANTIREKVNGVNVLNTVSKSIKQIESTWDCNYLININGQEYKPMLTYCLEITNNLYGNGYTLDCYQITTASSVDSRVNYFNGPLDFVALLNAAAVKGQDNIGFIVRDNVTIDNAVLQNCDDGYLYTNGLFDYSKLEKIGTTVEVMGDNVSIINSRIRNGRNTVRIFGTENPDQKINVRIESSIIANAREFLIKIGTNKSKDENAYIEYNGEKTYIRDLYEKYNMSTSEVSKYLKNNNLMSAMQNSCSPDLLNENGNKYATTNDNINDEYFVSTYVKTEVTLKNLVLINTNLYAIGMESKFSGAILGGYRFAPKDIEISLFEGSYNLSGTSYPAILNLEEDVRIYNWKKVSDISSKSLIERLEDAEAAEALGVKIELNVSQLISSFSKKEEYSNIVDYVNDEAYAHGGIVFYGGGKNYHLINLDKYTGYDFTKYTISFNEIEDDVLRGVLPWAAGYKPFVFYMYNADSEFKYQTQQETIENGSAYSWIKPVK